MMDDMLTAREVQDLLKLDRTTVYRMLKDGRLCGVKVGQQWRFPRREVAGLLEAARPESSAEPPLAAAQLPIHCVQILQDVLADLSDTPAITITPEGAPITQVSGVGAAASRLAATATRLDTRGAPGRVALSIGPDGLAYLHAPVELHGQLIARLVAGPLAPDQGDTARVSAAVEKVARAFEAIARERATVLGRLRQIAEISTVSL